MENVSLNFLFKKGDEPRCSPIPLWVFAFWFINLCWYPPFSQRMPTNWWLPRQIIWSTQVIFIYTCRLQSLSPCFLTTSWPMRRISNPECFSSFLFCFREAKVYFAGAYLPGKKLNRQWCFRTFRLVMFSMPLTLSVQTCSTKKWNHCSWSIIKHHYVVVLCFLYTFKWLYAWQRDELGLGADGR